MSLFNILCTALFAVGTIAGCAALWYCTGLPDPDESREGDSNHDRLQG